MLLYFGAICYIAIDNLYSPCLDTCVVGIGLPGTMEKSSLGNLENNYFLSS
jgi:hypothetical protein